MQKKSHHTFLFPCEKPDCTTELYIAKKIFFKFPFTLWLPAWHYGMTTEQGCDCDFVFIIFTKIIPIDFYLGMERPAELSCSCMFTVIHYTGTNL